MTPSTSETETGGAPTTPAAPTTPSHPTGLMVPMMVVVAIGAAMIVAALLRDRLTLGIVIFALAGTAMHVIRLSLTRGMPLAISHQSDGLRQQILVKAVGIGGFVLPFIYIATPWLDVASYRLPLWAVVLGGLCYAVGLWIFWRSHADLGRYWSPVLELREGHRLVTDGIYSRIRHPMYSAIFLFFIGQPLCIGNWIAGFSGLVAFAMLYAFRVGTEEQMLAETFGTDWQAYTARTGRLVPRF